MDIEIFESARELAEATARHLARRLNAGGTRSLGLAGGSTPSATYEALTQLNVNWDRVDLWLGDERWVPNDSPESNARMARERLLNGIQVDFHEIAYGDGSDPEGAAAVYEKKLDAVFSHTGGHADTVLLGLGDDGHTASLFPGSDVLEEDTRGYVATFVPHLDMWRLTATLPLLASADRVFFIISGESKSEAVRWLIDPRPGDPTTPARIVASVSKNVTVLMDQSASVELR